MSQNKNPIRVFEIRQSCSTNFFSEIYLNNLMIFESTCLFSHQTCYTILSSEPYHENYIQLLNKEIENDIRDL